MTLSIDHVVILVNDLDAANADYAALGFTVIPGGEHAGGATHNALISFADGSYLELIAFKRSEPKHFWWRHTSIGPGLIDFALLPSDIAVEIAAMAQRGLIYRGPTPGGRLRLDGQRIAWQMGMPPNSALPFLCADVTPRALRVPSGSAWRHANGVTGVAGLTVVVNDLTMSAASYRMLLGCVEQRQATKAIGSDKIEPGTQIVAFSVGNVVLTLAEPPPGSRDSLRERLDARGDGIYALQLHSVDPTSSGALDLKCTHGARIEIVA
ncbi:MAG: VOC family protein [Chloroflexales bacterium]|nr:VOC family protein [Chloroflexales bacterium]